MKKVDILKSLSKEEYDKLPSLTAEDFAHVREESRIAHEKYLVDQRHAWRTATVGTCNCGGMVVADEIRGYFGDHMHVICGPGSAGQVSIKRTGFFCRTCGLMYKFAPGEKRKLSNEEMDDIFVKQLGR